MRRARFMSGAAALWLVPQACAAANPNNAIEAAARRLSGTLGVYAGTLASNEPLVAYRSDEIFPTASIIKVLIMATAYAMDEFQPGTLSDEIVFDRPGDLIGGSDFMWNQPNGARFSVRQLIVPMIQVSDNTAANMLIEHFGVDTINGVGTDAGLAQTHLQRKFLDWYAIVRHSQNVSTPADMARLLYLIESGAHEGTRTIVSAPYCRTMVNIMLGQTDRDAIPAALPVGTPIANKTGEIDGTRDDVAIVDPYGTSPLILTVMTKAAYDYAASYAAIHAIARDVYAAAR